MLIPQIAFWSSPLDPDAADYISRVEAEDGQALEFEVISAINDFFVSLKSNSLLTDMGAACILAGARTIDGAIEPLVSTMPQAQAFNFASGDYDRKLGLLGDGATTYIDTNRANNVSGQNDQTLSVYVTEAATSGSGTHTFASSGTLSTVGGTSIYCLDDGNGLFSSRADGGSGGESYILLTGEGTSTGLFSVYRNSSTTVGARVGGTNTTKAVSSSAPNAANMLIFARPDGVGSQELFTDARISFFEEGTYKDPATLDTIVSQLMTDLDGAIA